MAGAVSMALGEYISVSSQRDSENAQLAPERSELAQMPDEELAEVAEIYRAKGLSSSTALLAATEPTAHDALAAHADVAFTLEAILPLIAIMIAPPAGRVPVTVAAVLSALARTGLLSSPIGGSRARIAVVRVVLGGAAGLALTYGIGRLFGSAVS